MREGQNGNRILVADDNGFIRFLVKKWLGDSAEIIETGVGDDVVELYDTHKPDILFLDIHLPGRNGKDILHDILQKDSQAYIIMLSADSMKDNVLYAAKTGAKAFITKPFTRETLHRYFSLCPTMLQPEGMVNTEAAEIYAN